LTTVPIPVTTSANIRLRPSSTKAAATPNRGAHVYWSTISRPETIVGVCAPNHTNAKAGTAIEIANAAFGRRR